MAQERSDRAMVLVSPIAPAATGNGLAMRAGMFLDALASVADVDVVLVPVSGPAETTRWAETRARRLVVVEPVGSAGAREHGIAQLADPRLRARLEMTSPMPNRAAGAPPTLAAVAADALDVSDAPPTAVLTMREYLVPFGLTLAHGLDAARAVVDLDDDVEHLYVQRGDTDSARAYHRLHRAWLRDATAVTLASPLDADRVAARYDRDIVTIPNAIAPVSDQSPLPDHDRVLFVANLTYAPNVDAARFLVDEVWPRVLEHRPRATLELVGRYDERLDALHAPPRVAFTGYVHDLVPHYAAADVVVAPLRDASGTRIKVLEGFAHRRPVVATTAAVAGLETKAGVDVLVADSARDFAAAVVRVLADRPLAERLAAAGSATLARRYTPDTVAPLIRNVVLGDGDVHPEASAP